MLSNKYPQVVFLEVDVHVCQVSRAATSITTSVSSNSVLTLLEKRTMADDDPGVALTGTIAKAILIYNTYRT